MTNNYHYLQDSKLKTIKTRNETIVLQKPLHLSTEPKDQAAFLYKNKLKCKTFIHIIISIKKLSINQLSWSQLPQSLKCQAWN